MRVERQLEREAYKAIREESYRERVANSAKSERVAEKRFLQWVEAAMAMEKKILAYGEGSVPKKGLGRRIVKDVSGMLEPISRSSGEAGEEDGQMAPRIRGAGVQLGGDSEQLAETLFVAAQGERKSEGESRKAEGKGLFLILPTSEIRLPTSSEAESTTCSDYVRFAQQFTS